MKIHKATINAINKALQEAIKSVKQVKANAYGDNGEKEIIGIIKNLRDTLLSHSMAAHEARKAGKDAPYLKELEAFLSIFSNGVVY